MSRGDGPRGGRIRHPPGLRGREIGLFYRDLHKKRKNEERSVINLKMPQPVLVALYKNIEDIEKIAQDENVYLSPKKKLQFIQTNHNADFIPLTAVESEKKTHTVTNIHKIDDDVIFVKNDEQDHISISSSDDDKKPIKEEIQGKQEYLVSNSFAPSTSKSEFLTSKSQSFSQNEGSGDFKYGYNDIITGSFQDKLQESIMNGLNINIQNKELTDLSIAMREELLSNMETPKYKEMMKFRQKLPTYKKAENILETINDNQVIVLSGETGCGKSTQIPQIILDDMIMKDKGANVSILVTQPRRIAASSLAMRVADERAENLGNSVGYAVRLEKVDSRPRGNIMFCTTGVLLVELETRQGLTNYSHVILDEVHERDCQIDIAMCMLKQVLQYRKDLKLILMSATIDAERLCAYFDGCPLIHVEGLAYPVEDIYLEDIIQMIKYQLRPIDDRSKPYGSHWKKKRMGNFDMQKAIEYKHEISKWIEPIKKKFDHEVYKTILDYRIEMFDLDLIVQLLIHISKGNPGAILVFLPGIGEITKLLKNMRESNAFPESCFDIHPLHSKLPTITQHKIFQRPPDHIRKIIIATNIAETSITIDDIVYVIDCGRMKYCGLNVEENITTLQVEWISQANLRQRRGRAGRCQPGICYHLVTSYRAQKLEERLLPELQRSNLLEPVLCIKRLRLGMAEEALKNMPGVPAEKTIKWAVKHLQQCGALDENETLTPLGWHLARIPVHPAAGKLLLLGALFGCLDRAASVAAVWGFKDPFQLVIGKEREIKEVKRNFTLGEPSDHVALSEAIIQWERFDSYSDRRRFAYENFLSNYNLELLADMKKQLGDTLKQMGFLKSADVKSEWENRNTDNLSLFKAIVAASLYPNIATVRWINKDRRKIRQPIRIKARTPEEGGVSLHPSSVMVTKMGGGGQGSMSPVCSNPGANWLVYWLKQKSTELFLIDVTLVYTLPLLFFGELKVTQAENADECFISISSIKVCCKKETTQLLFELRSLLDKVLASKIMISKGQMQKRKIFEERVLDAVIKLITAEDEGVEYIDGEQADDDRGYDTNNTWC